MAYKHGVYNTEQATSLTVPVQGSAGLQVVFGKHHRPVASVGIRAQVVAEQLVVLGIGDGLARAEAEHPQAGLQLQGGCGGRRLFGRFRELHPLPEH